MEPEEVLQKIWQTLSKSRNIARLVAVAHLGELRQAITEKNDRGLLNRELYREYLAGFNFDLPANLPAARSIFIIATPQPHVRVSFRAPNEEFSTLVPSTYDYRGSAEVEKMLRRALEPGGFTVNRAALPLKALAVHSGLARYGKNNITYIDGLGSLFRLSAFYTDLPCVEDNWGEMQMAERCRKCTTCVEKCPTRAIDPRRFLLHAERCLTFHNELEQEFPTWLDPAAHHCLIGCLYCQRFCPLNRHVSNWITNQTEFSPTETKLLLNYKPTKQLPRQTAKKLDEIGLGDDFVVLSRNLRMLVESPNKTERDRMCAPVKKGRFRSTQKT